MFKAIAGRTWENQRPHSVTHPWGRSAIALAESFFRTSLHPTESPVDSKPPLPLSNYVDIPLSAAPGLRHTGELKWGLLRMAATKKYQRP